MRFTTLPQMLAYSSTVRFGRGADDKVEIIGAFLETNSLFELYLATIEADVIRPEHHLDLPFLTDGSKVDDSNDSDWKSPDDLARWEMVHVLATRGDISTRDRSYKVVAAAMPLRGLPSATGSIRSVPRADMLLAGDGKLGVAAVRVQDTHPLLALVEGLDCLAHLNKPRVKERILAEVQRKVPGVGTVDAIDQIVLLGPPSWWGSFTERDQERRSGWTNANVMWKAIGELREGGVQVSTLSVGGPWQQGMFSLGTAEYAAAPEVPEDEEAEDAAAPDDAPEPEEA